MEVIKNRMNILKDEENGLQDKIQELDAQLSSLKKEIDELQTQKLSLQTTEKRLDLKLQKDNKRLEAILGTLSTQQNLASTVETERKNLAHVNLDCDLKLEDLVEKLRILKKETTDTELECEKISLRLNNVQNAKDRAIQRAEVSEKKVGELEQSYNSAFKLLSASQQGETKVDNLEDDLENQVLDLQKRLTEVTGNAEAAERDSNRLQLSIDKCKTEYSKQRDMNDQVRKDIEMMLKEIQELQ